MGDPPIAVAGILLTGGTSQRMGFDKTTLLVDGVPCAQRVAGVMRLVLDPVIEVGPGRSPLVAVREDPPGSGPLAAVAAGAQWLFEVGLGDRPAVVVAGDLPFVDRAALLMLATTRPGASVVPSVDGWPQPLCARWSPGALAEARSMAARGQRSMRDLLARSDVVLLDATAWPDGVDARTFSDIDTPGDLERLGVWAALSRPGGSTIGVASPSMTLDARAWIDQLANEMGVDPMSDEDVEAVLALAATAAHASERTAAPLSCWLAASAGTTLADALAIARRLAGETDEPS